MLAAIVCLAASIFLSVSASVQVRKVKAEVQDLTDAVESLTHNALIVNSTLETLDDKLDFLVQWCQQAPSVTLGDTYINGPDKVKLKK